MVLQGALPACVAAVSLHVHCKVSVMHFVIMHKTHAICCCHMRTFDMC